MADSHLIYHQRGALTAEQLRREIKEFWEAVDTDQALKDEVSSARIDLDQIDHLGRNKAIIVSPYESGADPNVLLLIALAPAANRALKDLWKTVVLPRIRRRWGDDAIGPEIERTDQ